MSEETRAPEGASPSGSTSPRGGDGAAGTPRDTRPWLQRHGPETLIGAVIVTLVSVVASAFLTDALGGDDGAASADSSKPSASSVPTPGCSGKTCYGLDANNAGCAPGAVTLRDDWVGTMHLEIRFSESCRAVWAKLTGAQEDDTVEISTSASRHQRATVLWGHTKYTPMLPVEADFSAQATAVAVKGVPDQDIPRGYPLRVSARQADLPPTASASPGSRPSAWPPGRLTA